MSIEAIRLRNFRGFRDATLELKPLTVLLGPNSSGKSSFGHALAATTHCQRRSAGGQRATLTPGADSDDWPIDLGTIHDLRTQGESGRTYVGFRTEVGWIQLGFGGLEPDDNGLALTYISHPFNPKTSGGVTVAIGQSATIDAGAQTGSEPVDSGKVLDMSADIAVSRIQGSESTWLDENEKQLASVDLDGLLLRSVQHAGQTFIPLRHEAQDALRFLFKTLTYLRATRERPLRNYPNQVGEWQRIGYAGEWAPALLQENGGDETSFLHPPDIPLSVEEAMRSLDQKWENQEQPLLEAVGTWFQQLGLARSVQSIPSQQDKRRLQVRFSLLGQQSHDITEIGFGVSQILPVLTAGLMQPDKSLFVVDLPEAHLHPWPQGRLADFFCSLALSGRRALVETHSEMFFHRLRLRAEMNRELLDKIAVYFIDEPKDGICQQPRRVGLRFDEELRWPAGFLQEAMDSEVQINSLRQARSKARK
jgi:predicted ATPase